MGQTTPLVKLKIENFSVNTLKLIELTKSKIKIDAKAKSLHKENHQRV
jgi:hypothetical protein